MESIIPDWLQTLYEALDSWSFCYVSQALELQMCAPMPYSLNVQTVPGRKVVSLMLGMIQNTPLLEQNLLLSILVILCQCQDYLKLQQHYKLM